MAHFCDAILKDGVFQTLKINYDRNTSENLTEWLKTMTWEQFKEKQDAGLKIGLPIKGIPLEIGASFTEDDFKEWKKEVDQGTVREFSESETLELIEINADPTLADAWLKCMIASIGAGATGLTATLEEPFPGSMDLVFSARYMPNTITDTPPTLLEDLQIAGATASGLWHQGDEIGYGGRSLLLRRNGKEGVLVTLNTTKGSASPSLAPIETPAPPAPVQGDLFIDVASVDHGNSYTFCIAGTPAAMTLIKGVAYQVETETNFHLKVGKPFKAQTTGTIPRYAQDAAGGWPIEITESHVENAALSNNVEVRKVNAQVTLNDGRIWNYQRPVV